MTNADRRRSKLKWPLLILLLYLPVGALLSILFPDGLIVHWLNPFGFFQFFLETWFDPRVLILVLSVLPLVGWLLMHLGVRQGKWVVNWLLAAFLAANVVVFFLHFITTMRMHDYDLFMGTVYFALACPIVCIPALILTNKWYPKI